MSLRRRGGGFFDKGEVKPGKEKKPKFDSIANKDEIPYVEEKKAESEKEPLSPKK